jgi:hypothetical protein
MTAVEWLVEQFDLEMQDDFHLTKIEQAKEMEKKDIIHFGAICCIKTAEKKPWKLEELYNKTFKK